MQGWDRYVYVNNSPVKFNDPTGHNADCGLVDSYCEKRKPKADIDYSKLSDYVYRGTDVSGRMMYDFYRQLMVERNGYLTIKEFAELVMAQEFLPYQRANGDLNFIPSSNFNEDLLKQTTANWYWGLHKGETTVTSEGMLNWISAFGSAGMVYRAGSLAATKASGLAHDVISYVYSIPGIMRNDPTAPSTFGNGSLFPNIKSASQGYGNNQYIAVWPNTKDNNPAYILSACQVAYQKGDDEYVDKQC